MLDRWNMTFFKKIQDDWGSGIQPILDDVCKGTTHIINGGEGFDIFKQCNPVELYTKIYNMTTSFHFDFTHLDFLYQKEMEAVVSFCNTFSSIHSLEEMDRHIQGFNLLIRWFYCFFHHLNRLREKVYPKVCGVEEDMKRCVRDHYLRTHKHTISDLICSHWDRIRSSHYPTDHVLLETMKTIAGFDPEQHHYLLLLYYSVLQQYSQQLSDKWLSEKNILVFMDMAYRFLTQEKKMFLSYFYQHQDDLPHLCGIIKKVMVDPHIGVFMNDSGHGWKALLRSNHVADIRVAYHFYSWYDDHTQWLLLYQEFLDEKFQSFQEDGLILSMVQLWNEQTEILDGVFLHEKTRGCFRDALNRVFQKKILQDNQVAPQLVRTIHQTFSKKRTPGEIMNGLMVLSGYCADKELYYGYYHQHMKTRLLSGRFNPVRERMVLGLMRDIFGSSFTLNLFLMLDEVCGDCLSNGPYHMCRLSRVVWDIDNKPLQYRPPALVEKRLQLLYDQWRQKTNTMMRLELPWTHGSVVLSIGPAEFIMSPTQAIVLLALKEPMTRQGLVGVLGVPDDDDHNVDGVLESLSRSLLIEKCSNDDRWCWVLSHKPGRMVLPPIRKKKTRKQDMGLSPVVVEASIVRTLKKEKQLSFLDLMVHLVDQYPDIQVSWARKLVENLVDREFISRENGVLCYVP